MGTLDGRVAVVTGSGRGIGRAIATRLAQDGARVVVNDLEEAPARDTAAALRDLTETHAVVGDVAAEDFGDRLIDETVGRFGTLDILVNNAGYIWNSAIQNHSDEQWYAMLDVHATGPFRILRAAARFFRRTAKERRAGADLRCRKVVNISSVSGVFGAATQLAYSAGKAAQVGMTKTLAKEWGRYDVTVNCVAFGDIDTRLTQPLDAGPATIEVEGRDLKVGLEREALERMRSLTPLGRRGSVDDAAGAVYLFCLPESDFVTGQVLVCSGGLTL